jgi:hypothetical protein
MATAVNINAPIFIFETIDHLPVSMVSNRPPFRHVPDIGTAGLHGRTRMSVPVLRGLLMH